MNENVKIDYDTAEKVMDLDGYESFSSRCRPRPTPAQVQGLCEDYRRQDVNEDHDDTRLQLGEVGGAEAAEARRRLVSAMVPRDALRLPDPSVMLCFHFRGSLDAL